MSYNQLANSCETNLEYLTNSRLDIVEEHTSRQLTYPESYKLTALSVTAKRRGQAMEDEHVASHFLIYIATGICWSISTVDNTRIDRTHLVARRRTSTVNKFPTWSWASMDPSVSFKWREWLAEDTLNEEMLFSPLSVPMPSTEEEKCTEGDWNPWRFRNSTQSASEDASRTRKSIRTVRLSAARST